MSSGAALVDESVDPALNLDNPKDVSEKEEIQLAESRAGTVKTIPINLIQKSEVALRDVNRQTEPFQLLLHSIRQRGILNSILVREVPVPGGGIVYGLIDGLQRYTCACDLGFTEIPARIVNMDDAGILEAQIITNMNRVQTRPAELSKHLLRILARDPLLTTKALAERICQSVSWVEQRLSLNKLTPEIQKLVDENRIHLLNAYTLSKVPAEEQKDHVDAAMTESPRTFVPRMKQRVKEIRDAKNAGRDTSKHEFRPVQYLQKVGDVKDEFLALSEGVGESRIKELLAQNNVKDPVEAVKLAIAWMLHYDPVSQAEQRESHEAKQKKLEESREKLKKEREQKKLEEAADVTTGF